MASFVLIHGAFQGSWVWRETAEKLRAAGHDVLAPGLTGLGGLSHRPRQGLGLADYIDDVVNAVCFEAFGPAVFVGHSFSGLVAAGAAARLDDLAVGLVFLDALIPEPGKSFADMAGPGFAAVLGAHTHDGWLVRPWPLAAFGLAESPKATDFAARLTSMPLAAFTSAYDCDPPGAGVPKAFLRCTRNPNPLVAAQAAKARDAGYAFLEIDTGHAPMIAAPDRLAEALAQCATGFPARKPVDPAYHRARLMRTPPARSGDEIPTAP